VHAVRTWARWRLYASMTESALSMRGMHELLHSGRKRSLDGAAASTPVALPSSSGVETAVVDEDSVTSSSVVGWTVDVAGCVVVAAMVVTVAFTSRTVSTSAAPPRAARDRSTAMAARECIV
jgi:hypothetical protein